MFIWFWFPSFLFTALSTFNWMSWIAPNNGPLNNIVGSVNGLGKRVTGCFGRCRHVADSF